MASLMRFFFYPTRRRTKSVTLCFITLYFITLFFITLCFIPLCFIKLCFITLSFITLCFITLCFKKQSEKEVGGTKRGSWWCFHVDILSSLPLRLNGDEHVPSKHRFLFVYFVFIESTLPVTVRHSTTPCQLPFDTVLLLRITMDDKSILSLS